MKKGNIELIQGDCMDVMSQYEDNYFDLVIVDPLYGIGESGGTNKTRGCLATSKNYKPFAGHDKEAPSCAYFDLLKRKSKNQIIFGANHFLDNMPLNISSPCWLVWDKDNGDTDFADCELAWTSFKTAVRKIKYKWQGMLQADMKSKEFRIHPTQKPVALYKWLLQNYAKDGDKILDTHLGSGSIAVACWDMGFDLEGYELDKEYFEAATKRLNLHKMQLQLY